MAVLEWATMVDAFKEVMPLIGFAAACSILVVLIAVTY